MCVRPLLTSFSNFPRGNFKLKQAYKRILMLLKKFPKDAAYRINTEAIICHRLSVVNEAGDDNREIEDNLCCGRIEALILQAENEYVLVQKMMLVKPWERLVQQPPPGQWDWPPAQV